MNYTCLLDSSNMTSAAITKPLEGLQMWEVVLIVLVTGPLIVVTIIGNLLVVVSFRVNAQLRTTSNYYLLSLAVADLILGTVSMNLYTATIIKGHWMLGPVACDIWLAVDYVASNASVMNLLVISFDRYFSVRRPLTYRAKRTPKRAGLLIAMAWTVSFILWGPVILFWPYVVGRSTKDGADQKCELPFSEDKLLTFGTAIAAFYLPVCIMVILYWRIYWEIENRSKGLALLLGQGGGRWITNRTAEQQTGHLENLQDNINRSNGTSAKTKVCQREIGCLPKSIKFSQPSRGKSLSNIMELTAGKRVNRFEEGDSRNSWSGDNEEEEEDVVSTSTEEEIEPESNAANTTFKLKPLGEPTDINREIKISPRASCKEGTTPKAKRPSVRSSRNGVDRKDMTSLASVPVHVRQHTHQKGKRRRNMIIREKKAARTLSAILLAFILTWTPYNVMVLVSLFDSVPDKLWQLGYWLCYVNSTVNPMCYALCNESFRRTFKSLLMCQPSRRKNWDTSHRAHRSSATQSSSTV